MEGQPPLVAGQKCCSLPQGTVPFLENCDPGHQSPRKLAFNEMFPSHVSQPLESAYSPQRLPSATLELIGSSKVGSEMPQHTCSAAGLKDICNKNPITFQHRHRGSARWIVLSQFLPVLQKLLNSECQYVACAKQTVALCQTNACREPYINGK